MRLRPSEDLAAAFDPIHLFQQVEQLQQAVFSCAVGCSPCVPGPPSAPLRVFSVGCCSAGTLRVGRASPIRQQRSTPCTASRRGENESWAGDAPRKIPLKESGSRLPPGCLLTPNVTVATSPGSCSASLQDAINHYKSALSSGGCARSAPIFWKPLKSSGKKK